MNEQHFYASDFILNQITGRKGERASDHLGTGDGTTSFSVALRLDGAYHCYTITQAETAAQAILKALEQVILASHPDALRRADLVEIVSVRESA